MSTRCLIGRKIKDNKVEYIYCHHDGYLDGVGKILKAYYTNDSVIDKLMSLGDLSSLDKEVESNPDQWNYNKVNRNLCVAYKDRGEENVNSKIAARREYIDMLNTRFDIEYLYLWNGEKWCYRYGDRWKAV